MSSNLLELGPVTIRLFGLMMATGFLCAGYAAYRLARGTHRNLDYLSNLIVWMMLSGVLGARLAYVAEHWSEEFAGHYAAILRIDMGGLMFYGGVLGATLALWVFARRHREPFLAISDLLLAVLPLGHAFGRIGCFLNGCCHGRISSSCLAVSYPQYSAAWHQQVSQHEIAEGAIWSRPVLPTQLFECGANLILFLLLYRLYRHRSGEQGVVTAAYLMGYGAIRFLMESLRGDPRLQVGALSIGQAISVVLFFAGLGLLVWLWRHPAPPTPPRPATPS
jgi:phosphatidylglycerol:prolipoprotein diacylglycerol transferase